MNSSRRRFASSDVQHGEVRLLGVHGPVRQDEQIAALDEAARSCGFEQGYAEGVAKAEDEAGERFAQRVAAWEREAEAELSLQREGLDEARRRYVAAVSELEETAHAGRHWAEALSVEIAFAAVTRWLGRAWHDRAAMEILCREARRDVGDGVERLRVSATDLTLLSFVVPGLEVVADDLLPVGSCVLETKRGQFDIGLEARLDLFKKTLLATLASGGGVASDERRG